MQTEEKTDVEDYKSVLSSVDPSGRRKWLYVDIARGAWRLRRKVLAFFLIAIYLLTPFIHIAGNPLLRIDIPSRTYTLFGNVFWPQDFSYALMFVVLAIIATLLAVSVCGRVFCGWVCPHNMFLEMVFRPIERLLEGPAHRRRLHDKKQQNINRLMRKTVKNIAYLLVSGALCNAATAIFVGTDAFIWGIFLNPVEHPSAAIFYGVSFGLIMFNFGWFREQTCSLVCPYGRLQTVMLDSDTLVVAYDPRRGEPRGRKRPKNESEEQLGDCIDCNRCVQVCPTGIDIRNGNQLECIHCTACIDACDTVMDKLGKESGMISYISENMLKGEKRRIIRPRTILYAIMLSVLTAITLFSILNRPLVDIVQLRQRVAPHIVTADNDAAQQIEYLQILIPLSFVNKSKEDISITMRLADETHAQIITQFNPLILAVHQRVEQIFYIRLETDWLNSGTVAADGTELLIMYNDGIQKRLHIPLRRTGSAVKK